MTKVLAIFGQPKDPHILRVSAAVRDLGHKAVFYSPISDTRLAVDPVSWSPAASTVKLLDHEGVQIEIEIEQSVWWLRNKFEPYGIFNETDQRRYFEVSSRRQFFAGLAIASGARVINGVNTTRGDNKISQLALAARLGFPAPDTLVSSDREAIKAFAARFDGAVVKALGVANVPPITNASADRSSDIFVMTNEITAEEIARADADTFSSAPLIVQRQIAKAYELRCFAFGSEVLCFRVDSQKFEYAKTDWRRAEREPGLIDLTPIDPGSICRQFIADFLMHSGLDVGVFDFVVEEDGRIVFLECNPAGQWGRLENSDERKVSALFARCALALLD